MKSYIRIGVMMLALCVFQPLAAKDWSQNTLAEVQQAAAQGDSDAQYVLGLMYSQGLRVTRDDKQAVMLIYMAALRGHAMAQYLLGSIFADGLDNKLAASWYRKAAEQGVADAQFSLGSMYENGLGVTQDTQQAYIWYSVAAANGNQKAVQYRDNTAKLLTPAALYEAQKLAAYYFAQYQPKP